MATPKTDAQIPDAVEQAAKFPLYLNPLRDAKNLVLDRTDQGVDYRADNWSAIYPIGLCKISRVTTKAGWPGGGCVQYILLEGPHAGEEIYVAEFIKPKRYVKVGKVFEPTTSVARFTRSPSSGVGIEMGFIRPGTWEPCSTDTSGEPTNGGKAFARFLRKTGCPTRDNPGPGSSFCPCGHH